LATLSTLAHNFCDHLTYRHKLALSVFTWLLLVLHD
jgi:hypothetical protein